MVKILALVLLVVACKPTTRELRALVGESEGCLCPCPEDAGVDVPDAPEPDAAVDAPPDAPAPISLTEPWTMTVIAAGAPTGTRRGADGVSLAANGRWISGWEEGGAVSESDLDTLATEDIAVGLPRIEHAIDAGDLDGDGTRDVVACSDAGRKCYAIFRGVPSVPVVLTGSQGHNAAMSAAVMDVDGDGLTDIVYGTRFTSSSPDPAVIAVLYNPGPLLARDGAAWTKEIMSRAGWTMSLVVVGGRVVVSDRASYKDAAGVVKWDLYGARWLERTSAGWVNHPISPPAGAGPGKTPGDEMFLRVIGDDVWDCTSKLTGANRIAHHHNVNGDWLTWTTTTIPDVAGVGHCQGVDLADVDGDGRTDIVVSGWKGNTLPFTGLDLPFAGASGVWWLRNTGVIAPNGEAIYERGEVAGSRGCKFDNAEVITYKGAKRIITSESLGDDCAAGTGHGGLGVIMYSPPGAP